MQCVWLRVSLLARRVVREHGEGAQWTAKQEISRKRKKKKEKRKKKVLARVSWRKGHGNAVCVAKSKSIGKEGGEGAW